MRATGRAILSTEKIVSNDSHQEFPGDQRLPDIFWDGDHRRGQARGVPGVKKESGNKKARDLAVAGEIQFKESWRRQESL